MPVLLASGVPTGPFAAESVSFSQFCRDRREKSGGAPILRRKIIGYFLGKNINKPNF
jgi:hypothetical protein